MEELGRRAVLTAGLATALGLAACDSPTPVAEPAFDPHDWNAVRALFPLDPKLVHMAAFVLATHPKPVQEAIERHRRGLDLDTDWYLHANDGPREDAVRAAAAAYLGGRPEQVALTDSTTMGLGLLYSGLRVRPDQDVVTSTHDFVAHHRALDALSHRTGAPVRKIALYDDPRAATEADVVTRLRAAIAPNTRVVGVTWVHSGTGVRLPVPAIAAMLAEVNAGRAPDDRALLCVDGVHGFGAVDLDVAGLGCDFLSTGTHKWLFGPRGTGLLWGRAWDALAPVIPSFEADDAPGGIGRTPGGYHSFEHRWAVLEAFELHRGIGRDRIAQRVAVQATRLKAGLATVPSVRLVTPDDPAMSAGIVCCEVDGVDAVTARGALREAGVVASVTPYAQQYLRFGPSIVTTPAQVDEVVGAVRALRP
ncbi:aminotransferase class V-fold PLP-dependent enzyme [Actinophytocola oryzae]|uniref:Selenocysteine lyase/cysteine desulfurase n=1 Tax=Actinophytocola oryzae TaxID=502181 RepID=A0A4R7V4R6_9PSEU|nr:aminotransferase class V-fold PLP-dependent enzyme [Actinophytocola oryzae]TDV43647.1 selenocysteine lyase/cysteine desulfurase [Actinophytocola oryzae]